MLQQRLMWIIWPAFLMAGVLEMLVFGMVDPQDVHWFGMPLDWSRQGTYTIAFFVFWAIMVEVNRCPLTPTQRPDGCPKQESC